ncbi:winged helix DNA-binding domain-containing protein [Luteipulveratus mongoliensis]|uniref:Winged helix DNA-binding domain-containing protein n=1 Tax=Luteipulveratus mongoliensis TaxID=571913 RepID=A0A0K1JIL7_9MICO|nr:winged helix DNA-binding domain-containing protein [Luteipulveratus mongoliensis]AKU16425.1 hypothetical protein VV02_12040 [Luteipulveratus mongoliensis]
MTSLADVGRMRLVAQRLVASDMPDVTSVVRWMTCMQAQDLPAARIAMAKRAGTRSLADVDATLDSGAVVRTWPMRGTLHVLLAEDVRWMTDLTRERQNRQARRTHEELGITDAVYERAEGAARTALAGDGLLRNELLDVWRAAGLDVEGQRGYHVIGLLATRGVICQGAMTGKQQRLVLIDEWVPQARELERDEAIVEWATRYFRSHGPATLKDFLWWTKLLASEVKPLMPTIMESLECVTVDGTDYFMDPETPERYSRHKAATAKPMLLSAFDELLLGYTDRSANLLPQDFELVVPGKNGVFFPTVAHRGRIVATWKRPAKPGATVAVEPFSTLDPVVDRALPRLSRALPQ